MNESKWTRSIYENAVIDDIYADDYQTMAARTISGDLYKTEIELHALHGISGEAGEIHSLYQKMYQGHKMDDMHLKKEIGDLLWFVAELCTVRGFKLSDVMLTNLAKLRERYPEGFEAKRSLNRAEGDI